MEKRINEIKLSLTDREFLALKLASVRMRMKPAAYASLALQDRLFGDVGIHVPTLRPSEQDLQSAFRTLGGEGEE